jgi:hypothetical protein
VIYLFIDLILEINVGITERITIIIHHLISIFFTLWARINNYGIYLLPEMVYAILVTESSTIFLNINKLIKIYLDSNANSASSFTSILKNISTMNYLFFLPLFVYFRNYKIFIDGIFNPEFYAKLLAPRDDIYHYLNRIVLLMLVALSALNIYWLIPVVKGTYKKISHLFKDKSDKCIKKEDKQDNKNKKSEVDAFVKEIDVDSNDDDDGDEEEQEKKEDVTNKKEEEIKEEVSNKKEEEVSNKKEEDVKI